MKKTITGKKYYKIGKGKYLKVANTLIPPIEDTDKVLFTVYLKDFSEIYKAPNGDISDYGLSGKLQVYEVFTDASGLVWYRTRYQNWIKADETTKKKAKDKTSGEPVSDIIDDDSIKEADSMRNSRPLTAQETQEVKNYFLQFVNDWRAGQDLAPFILSSSISEGSQLRADESVDMFTRTGHISHTMPNDEKYKTAFPKQSVTEIAALRDYDNDSTKDMTRELFNQFVYHDEKSNWGHRELSRANYSKPIIGIGLSSAVFKDTSFVILYANTGNDR